MAKFKVTVTVKAECEYVVEVEADAWDKAEEEARALWREKLPDDFQVEKGYITDWEAESEQLTAICPDCFIEHTIPTLANPIADSWHEDYEYCKPCGAKIELEDKANG